ncbi:hypothetical protein DXZ75_10735 [Streptomyces sp. AcE210]|nr:hypothetical protein DXZ75_10735 [Streptomyces sp. AcE210]
MREPVRHQAEGAGSCQCADEEDDVAGWLLAAFSYSIVQPLDSQVEVKGLAVAEYGRTDDCDGEQQAREQDGCQPSIGELLADFGEERFH